MISSKLQRFKKWIREVILRNAPYIVVFVLSMFFLLVLLFNNIVITVRSGEAGVLYRRFFSGTEVEHPYYEGLHIIWPWDKMFVYSVRNQALPHAFEVLTKEGLPISINLTIRYRPELDLIGVLHQKVGPDYRDIIVKPEVEAAIRGVIGRYEVDEVYTTKRALVQKIVNESLEQTAQKYVKIDDVLLTKVTLPEEVKKAIEAKLVEEQRYEAYEYILRSETEEAKRKRIEAGGIRDFQKIIAETLSQEILAEKGIRATHQLAKSKNSKIVVIGSGENGLPLILGGGK